MNSAKKTKWKRGGSAEAKKDPMSDLYLQMRAWTPMEGRLTQDGVLLSANAEQACVLSRACFGLVILTAATPSNFALRDSYLPTRLPRILEVDGSMEEGLMFQLGLEEAFFLCHQLHCLHVYCSISECRRLLNCEELWSRLLQQQPLFLHRYKGFEYLRARHWVVRPGHQYGSDFLAYRHHPELVHSEYAVIIVPEDGDQKRLITWTDIHAMNRLCGSVSKKLLVLHVVAQGGSGGILDEDLNSFYVEAALVDRWLPEEHREASTPSS